MTTKTESVIMTICKKCIEYQEEHSDKVTCDYCNHRMNYVISLLDITTAKDIKQN